MNTKTTKTPRRQRDPEFIDAFTGEIRQRHEAGTFWSVADERRYQEELRGIRQNNASTGANDQND